MNPLWHYPFSYNEHTTLRVWLMQSMHLNSGNTTAFSIRNETETPLYNRQFSILFLSPEMKMRYPNVNVQVIGYFYGKAHTLEPAPFATWIRNDHDNRLTKGIYKDAVTHGS